jgi:hypothetical protein
MVSYETLFYSENIASKQNHPALSCLCIKSLPLLFSQLLTRYSLIPNAEW